MWLSTLNSTRSSGKAMLQQRPPTCTRSQYSEYAGGCHCRWTVPTIAFSLTIPLSSSNTKTILLHLLGFTGLTTFSILLGFAAMALQSPHLSPRGAQLRLPKRDTKSPLSILGDIGYRNWRHNQANPKDIRRKYQVIQTSHGSSIILVC